VVPHWMQAQFPSAPVPRWMLSTVRLAGPGLVQQPQARLGLGLLDWSLQATNNAGLSPETSTSQISSAPRSLSFNLKYFHLKLLE